MTAIFNMLFLLQKRISKLVKGEAMDEELFRTYFIRLFRGIRQMETKFKDMMDPEEEETFVKFSKSLPDLAQIFKITKQEKQNELVKDVMKRKVFKQNQLEASKMIYGVGLCPPEMKNKTCIFRIVPSKILGFSKVQQILVNDRHGRSRDPNRINRDLSKVKKSAHD